MDESKCDLRTNIQWTAKNHDNEVKCTCGNRKKKAGTYGDMWGNLGELWNFKRHAAN